VNAQQFFTQPVRIIENGFATNHLLVISLVRQQQDKAYKNPFYAFFSGAPAGKNGANKTYLRDRDHAIIFKLDLPRLNSVRFALLAHAAGAGNNIAKPFYHWADPAKANAPESKITKGKNFSIASAANSKSPGERIVTIAFNAGKEVVGDGQKKEEKGGSFQLTFHPFEAMSVADSIQYMIAKARELEAQELNQRSSGYTAKQQAKKEGNKGKGQDDYIDLGGFWDGPTDESIPSSAQQHTAQQGQGSNQAKASEQRQDQPQNGKSETTSRQQVQQQEGKQGQAGSTQPASQTQGNKQALGDQKSGATVQQSTRTQTGSSATQTQKGNTTNRPPVQQSQQQKPATQPAASTASKPQKFTGEGRSPYPSRYGREIDIF